MISDTVTRIRYGSDNGTILSKLSSVVNGVVLKQRGAWGAW